MSARPFLHIHMRKTAGTSLRALLINLFPANRILENAHSVMGPQTPGDALFVTGHVTFDYVHRFSAPPTIFTVVRDPVSRALSAYQFYRANDERFFERVSRDWSEAEYRSRRLFTSRAQELGLRRLLVEEESLAQMWLSNAQARHLAGAACRGLAYDHPSILKTALHHLRQCDVVGVVERLNDTLRLLGHAMNWGRLGPLQDLNETVPTSETPAIDPECIETLRAWNAWDLCVYKEAYRQFETRMRNIKHLPPDEVLSDAADLADARHFTPELAMRGYGWHEREYHEGQWLCWTSAPRSTLVLSISSPASHFRCSLARTISYRALETLSVAVNSVPLNLTRHRSQKNLVLEAHIPSEALEMAGHVIRITFDCPSMQRPCEIDPSSSDRRPMGVAIASVEID